jgi:PAS domain S-box-containing protein
MVHWIAAMALNHTLENPSGADRPDSGDTTERISFAAGEKSYQQFLDLFPESIAVFVEERFAFINPRGVDLLGATSPQEIHGRLLWDVVHPDCHAAAKDRMLRCGRERHAISPADFRLIRFDGATRDIESICASITFGARPAVLAVWRDLTGRREARYALHRYQLITDNIRDIVLFMRLSDGRILDVNRAALAAYGYSREELLELNIRDLRAPETRKITPKQMAEAYSQGLLFETIHRAKDGRRFAVEVSSRGADIDGTRTLISVIRDITDRKTAAQQLAEFEAAVKVILQSKAHSTLELEESILLRVKNMVLPYLEKLSAGKLTDIQRSHLGIMESQLKDIVKPFTSLSSVNYYQLTETEIQIAEMVKRGKTTKEIAALQQSSTRAVEFHRNNLRRKLGICNRKSNLKDILAKVQ